MCKIGYCRGEYICPFCNKSFYYNTCEPLSGLPAHEDWWSHIQSEHKAEWEKLKKTHFKKLPNGKSYPDFDMLLELNHGILPKEAKKNKKEAIKKQIKIKNDEINTLKKQLEELEK